MNFHDAGKNEASFREFKNIYAHKLTYLCALGECIPCLYKIYPSRKLSSTSAARNNGFVELPPNQRPEQCKRFCSTVVHPVKWEYRWLYPNASKLLTVGDGDFSFSLCLAECIYRTKKIKTLVATSYESEAVVNSVYCMGRENIERLKALDIPVVHNIDGTSLPTTLLGSHYCEPLSFDVVVWNFPCVADGEGADGQTKEMEKNQQLLRAFFSNVQSVLSSQGEVHITHKTIEPFSWWGIVQIAEESGFQLDLAIVFDKCNFPGYVNRKALDKKSFPCNDALTYIFQPTRNAISKDSKVADMLDRRSRRRRDSLVSLNCEQSHAELFDTAQKILDSKLQKTTSNSIKRKRT